MKFLLLLLFILIFFGGGFLFFSSNYANTDYFRPITTTEIKDSTVLKLYSTVDDCYLQKGDSQKFKIPKNRAEILLFRRDLRDGSFCFKVRINNKIIGYAEATGVRAIDLITKNGISPLFEKTLFPFILDSAVGFYCRI